MSDPAHPPAGGGKDSIVGKGLGILLLVLLAGYAVSEFLTSTSNGARNAYSARPAWDWLLWTIFFSAVGGGLVAWIFSKKE